MEPTTSVDWATIGVMVALAGLLWRAIWALDNRLSQQMSELTANMRQVSDRLSRLGGWIEGSRGRPVTSAYGDPVTR